MEPQEQNMSEQPKKLSGGLRQHRASSDAAWTYSTDRFPSGSMEGKAAKRQMLLPGDVWHGTTIEHTLFLSTVLTLRLLSV